MTLVDAIDHVDVSRATGRGQTTTITIERDAVKVQATLKRFEDRFERTVFQTEPVLSAWVRTIGARAVASEAIPPESPPTASAECDWFAVVAYDAVNAEPLLILPLVRRRQGAFTVIEAADLGVCDFNGAVLRRNFAPSPARCAEIWNAILRALPSADVLRLSKLPTHSGTLANPLLLLPGVREMRLSHLKMPLTTEDKPWTTEALPPATRELLAERRRKLAKRGRLSFRTAVTDAHADQIFSALLIQRESRCRELGRDNILRSPRYQEFYRSLVVPCNPSSIGSLQALYLDEDIIATGYGLIANQTFHMIFPTFQAERWRNYSPGLQLFAASMEWSVAQGLTHYDFTIGAEAFKRDLGAEVFPLHELLIALSPKGRIVVAADQVTRYVKSKPALFGTLRRYKSQLAPILAPVMTALHI